MNPLTDLPQILIGLLGRTTEIILAWLNGGSNFEYPGKRWVLKQVVYLYIYKFVYLKVYIFIYVYMYICICIYVYMYIY